MARVSVQSLEEVYNIVKKKEDLRVNGEERPEMTASAVQTKPRYPSDEKEKGIVCKHCTQSGHSSDSCYTVIDFPEWWGDRPKSITLQGRDRGGASSSGGSNRGRGPGQVTYANHVYVPNVENLNHEQVNHVIRDQDRDGVNGLSEQQWRAIKSILNTGKENTTEKVSGKSSSSS